MLITGGVLVAAAVWGLVIRTPPDARRQSNGDGYRQELPPEYHAPEFPPDAAYAELSSSVSRQSLAEAVASSFRQLGFGDEDVKSFNEGVFATTGLLSAGDVEQYLAYRFAYSCALKPSAAAVADRHHAGGRLPDIDDATWQSMSAAEKFKAVASDPESRNATVLSAASGAVRAGLGQRGSIPVGYRTQGLLSGFTPPSPDLFIVGADTEWSWVEIPVKLAVSDEAILRFEFVHDPAINAWLLQRAALLAPESVKLPWIVF